MKLHHMLAAMSAMLVVACSLKLQVALFNNAEEAMTIRTENGSVIVGPELSRQIDYPGESQGWGLRLSTARCDYVYFVPKTLEHYPWSGDSNNVLKVQVERDMSLYLLPPSSKNIMPIDGLQALQQDGFPLRPVETECH